MKPTLATQPKLDTQIALIEALIRRCGPVSRESIHQLTDIRRSAVSEIVRALIEEGRIVEAGRASNGTGRKQVLLELNESFRSVAVVEFNEDTVTAGITDLAPRLLAKVTEPTDLSRGVDGLVAQLMACIRRAMQKAGVSKSSLIGMGIADPGLVDSRRGVTVMSSTIGFWKQVPLKQLFEDEFGLDVVAESRTRAKAFAERMLGAGAMADNLVYVDYGVGIGSGVILDQKLVYGQSCAAGEFGHTHVVENGPACNCGSFGCLEALVGARAVETRIRRAISEGGYTHALETVDNPDKLTVWNVLEEAGRGDKICSNIVAEMGAYLGLGVANLVNLFNPAVVVLDSRLAAGGDALLDQIANAVKRQALTCSSEDVAVRFGTTGRDAAVLGTALIVIEKHFSLPELKLPAAAPGGECELEVIG